MDASVIGALFSAACLVVTFVVLFRLRSTKLVYITDFQAGLCFRDQADCTTLRPGAYFSSPNRNPITVVDMRPYLFMFERMGYKDKLQTKFIISIGGEFVISDPQLAVSTSKDLVNDALALIRDGLRIVASRSIVDSSIEGRSQLTASLSSELNLELHPRGIETRNLEITEIWAQSFKTSKSALAN